MAVDFITPLIKVTVDLLAHALAHARRRLGKKKYEQLLSTAIAELLKEHPDIDRAKARLAASKRPASRPARICCGRSRCLRRSRRIRKEKGKSESPAR